MTRKPVDPIAYAWQALHKTPCPFLWPDSRIAAMESYHRARAMARGPQNDRKAVS